MKHGPPPEAVLPVLGYLLMAAGGALLVYCSIINRRNLDTAARQNAALVQLCTTMIEDRAVLTEPPK